MLPPEPASGPCAVAESDALTLELPTWNLQVSQRDWDKLHEDVYADIDVPAALCVEGVSYSIELELQGSSTRKLAKKSFDLKWKKSKPLRSWPFDRNAPESPVAIRKVFLKAMAKDQSLAREALGYDLFRALGYETPNIGFANLRINGAYWGLYAVVEPVNENFIAAHGYPQGGRLYKAVRKHGSRADFAPGRDLTRAFETALVPRAGEGDGSDRDSEIEEDIAPEDRDDPDETADPANPLPSEPERVDESPTAPSEDDSLPEEYAELEALVSRFQKTPLDESAFESEIDPDFSLDAYFDRMLWVAFTQNGDAVAQNFFLYHSTSEAPARWYQLPWDSDIAFGADYRDVDSLIDTASSPLVDGGNYFSRRLLEVPGLRARYTASSLGLLDRGVLESEGFEQLAHYRARLSHDLDQDRGRWKRQTDARTAFDRIEDFVAHRGAVLRKVLLEL